MNQILAMSNNKNKEQKKAIENDEYKVNNNLDKQTNDGATMPGTGDSAIDNSTTITTPTLTQDINNNVPETQTNTVNNITQSVQNNIESAPVQPQVNSVQNTYDLNNMGVNTVAQTNSDLNIMASTTGTLNNNNTMPIQNIQNDINLNSTANNVQNNVDLNNPVNNVQNNINLNSSGNNTQGNFDVISPTNNIQNNIDLNSAKIDTSMPNNVNMQNPNDYNSSVNSAPAPNDNRKVENYNDYEGNRKKKKERKVRENSGDVNSGIIKRAAIIFSVILIVFALVIITVKLIPMIKKSGITSAPNAEINKPQIVISRLDENTISLSVKYTEEITKLRYWWNEDLEHIEEKNNNILSMEVTIPEGEVNTIHIEVQDKTGAITELSQDLVREKPKIQFIKDGDSIEIIAASDKGISSLVYYWNDEEANTVLPTEDNEFELSTTIEMRRGMNTLYAILTDSEGNTEQLEEMIKGVKKPEIKIQFSQDQLLAVIIISHDMGLEKIEFDVNGKTTIFDSSKSGYDSEKTKYRFKVAIKPGMVNTITVKAYSNEDLNDTEKTSEEVTKECDLTDIEPTEEE